MFEDGGLGIQLSIAQTANDLRRMFDNAIEDRLVERNDQLHDAYNRLLAYTQRIETQLAERNRQLAAAQAELATKTQQLAAKQSELQEVIAFNDFQASERHLTKIALEKVRREAARLRDIGSQPT